MKSHNIREIKIKNKELKNVTLNPRETLLQCKMCGGLVYADQMKKHGCYITLQKKKDPEIQTSLTEEEQEKFKSPAYINYLIDIKPVVLFHYKMPNFYRTFLRTKRIKNPALHKTVFND